MKYFDFFSTPEMECGGIQIFSLYLRRFGAQSERKCHFETQFETGYRTVSIKFIYNEQLTYPRSSKVHLAIEV